MSKSVTRALLKTAVSVSTSRNPAQSLSHRVVAASIFKLRRLSTLSSSSSSQSSISKTSLALDHGHRSPMTQSKKPCSMRQLLKSSSATMMSTRQEENLEEQGRVALFGYLFENRCILKLLTTESARHKAVMQVGEMLDAISIGLFRVVSKKLLSFSKTPYWRFVSNECGAGLPHSPAAEGKGRIDCKISGRKWDEIERIEHHALVHFRFIFCPVWRFFCGGGFSSMRPGLKNQQRFFLFSSTFRPRPRVITAFFFNCT